MEEQRFDELTKALVRPTSRRQMLKVVGAAVFGGWAATRGAPRVLATGTGNCANEGNSCAAEKCCQPLVCATTTSNSTQKFCCNTMVNTLCGNDCCPVGASCVSPNKCMCPMGKKPCTSTSNPFGVCLECCTDADCSGNPLGSTCCGGVCTTCPLGGTCSGTTCCVANNGTCSGDGDCCSVNCSNGQCCSSGLFNSGGTCCNVGLGAPCNPPTLTCCDSGQGKSICGTNCASGVCTNNVCCNLPGGSCPGPSYCCGNESCIGGTCQCVPSQSSCFRNEECCSGTCSGGVCT